MYGEVVLNYNKDNEVLATKNSEDEVVTFSSDTVWTNYHDRVERVIAEALNDLNDNKLSKNAADLLYQEIGDYADGIAYDPETGEVSLLSGETVLDSFTIVIPDVETDEELDAESTNPIANSVVTENLIRIDSVTAAALNDLNDKVSDIEDDLDTKQDALTFDSAPTANSTNPVTSGGIKTALDGKLEYYDLDEDANLAPILLAFGQGGTISDQSAFNTACEYLLNLMDEQGNGGVYPVRVVYRINGIVVVRAFNEGSLWASGENLQDACDISIEYVDVNDGSIVSVQLMRNNSNGNWLFDQTNTFVKPILTEHQSLASYANAIEYDSTNKRIYLKNGSTRLSGPIDATDFIKDGMLDSVVLDNNDNLVFTFNVDSGKQAITIPLSRFNLTIDSELSKTSSNPVQNKAIHKYITDIEYVVSQSLNDLETRKQNALTFDSTPTPNSNNPVTSGGIYDKFADYSLVISSALNDLNDKVTDLDADIEGKQDTLTFDDAPTANSNNPVKSSGVKTALDGKQDDILIVTFTITGTDYSTYYSGTLDKTHSEILNAMQAGRNVYMYNSALYGGTYVMLTQITGSNTHAFISLLGTDLWYCHTSMSDSSNECTMYKFDFATSSDLADKQDTLVSGTNIKTVNGTTLLGSGNIDADDVVHGMEDDGDFYEVTSYSGANPTFSQTAVTGNENKIYVDVLTNKLYRYDPSTLAAGESHYKQIGGPEIDDELDLTSENPVQNAVIAQTIQQNELVTAAALNTLNDNKQDKLTFDSTPTANSTNPVTSGGIKSYIDNAGFVSSETDPVFTASAAYGISSSDITNWNSKTSNVGTITGITMNGVSKGTSGVVDLGTVPTSLMTEITYSALVTLRGNSGLTPGMWYRITDYATTTTQSDTHAAGHNFDVVVLALSTNKLCEEARAILHSGDSYFANSNLAAWRLWYSLDNNHTLYAWADTSNGKGVIYRMIDEWNNDCPYDFKNIQFKRPLTDYEYDEQGTDTWVYTFNAFLGTTQFDNSMGLNLSQLGGSGMATFCGNNKIGTAYDVDNVSSVLQGSGEYVLNDIVFNCFAASAEYIQNLFCVKNVFGVNCVKNTFGNVVYSNSFGDNFSNNIFEDNTYFNVVGHGFTNNVSKNSFNGNTIGNNVSYNTFNEFFTYNIIGNDCRSNTFSIRYVNGSDGCFSYCSVGNGCQNCSFEASVYASTFGNNLYHVVFTTDTYTNIIVESGVNYVNFSCNSASMHYNHPCMNVKICQGVSGTSNTPKAIVHPTVDDTYITEYKPANSQTITV